MKKNKKLYIIIIVLLIALGICISISFTRSISKNKTDNKDKDIINIDCNDENCEKETKEKDKTKDDNNSSVDNPQTGDNNKNEAENTGSNNSDAVIVDGNSTSRGLEKNNNNQSNNLITNETKDASNNSNNRTIDENNTSETTGNEINDKNFVVSDSYQIWKQNTELKMFDVDFLAPGASGSYDFIINNNTGENVEYNIEFSERNASNANLMYKLKRNNEYIAGNDLEWKYYSDLNINNKVLNSTKNDSYTIEWKWVDSDHDTAAGRYNNATYGLSISVYAEDTDKIDTTTGSRASFNPDTGDKILYYIELAILSSIILVLLIIKKRQKD